MPTYEDDVPGLRELYRTVVDFRDEWRTQMGGLVRKDVHSVEHQALLGRLGTLERDRDNARIEAAKERATMKNQVWGAVLGAALSLMVALIVAWAK